MQTASAGPVLPAPCGLKSPDPHSVHTVPLTVESQRPGEHASHDVSPGTALNRPIAHARQTLDALCLPIGHPPAASKTHDAVGELNVAYEAQSATERGHEFDELSIALVQQQRRKAEACWASHVDAGDVSYVQVVPE